MGLPLPGDEGERYFPGGYRVREVGPDKGMEGWEGERERVLGMGGCTFEGVVGEGEGRRWRCDPGSRMINNDSDA